MSLNRHDGVIGACAAYSLSLRGIEVIVIERAEVAAAASGKAGGFLGLNWCADTPRATHGEPSRRREASHEATDDGRPRMIRIERHEEVRPGVWRYTVPAFGIEGRSRIPPLDACTASDPWCAASLRAHGLGT